jgi:hypothetical protein
MVGGGKKQAESPPMTRLLLFASAAYLTLASIANAATVTIGLQQVGVNGGAITAVASGNGSAQIGNLPYGTFTSNTVDGTGRPILPLPDILDSSSLNVTSDGAGVLRVYVTSQNNTDVSNVWLSSFTTNRLTAGWSVMEQTFLDPNNGLFTTAIALGSAVFNSIGTSAAAVIAASGGNYSVTHLYTIVATGVGVANSTINLSTPIPGALPLFATGLLGLWALRRKRKNTTPENLDAVA